MLSPRHGEDIVRVQSDPYVGWNQDKHTSANELTGSTLASTSLAIGVLYFFMVCPGYNQVGSDGRDWGCKSGFKSQHEWRN